jgi:hypothetical protein
MQRLRRRPRVVLAVAALTVLVAAAVAYAAEPAIQTFTPKSERQITNIDVLRQQIKNYYGVPLATTGPTGSWQDPLNLDSNYAHEAEGVADDGGRWLDARSRSQKRSEKKAIILDVDDTTLATFNYELYSNWDFNPMTNADFVLNERFPAVPGMVDMVNRAKAEDYAIIFLTGRPGQGQPTDQEPATLLNLTNVGYPTPTPIPTATLGGGSDGIFTKPAPANYPPYLQTACAEEIAAGKTCTTIHYKSATRGYVESLGYDIVANFGDQFSDLVGGFADRTFKMPNPNYFLP